MTFSSFYFEQNAEKLIKDAKNYKYVEYNRISCKDYYNKIFSYIKDDTIIPFRLTNEAKPNNKKNKKIKDKRIEFKAMVKDKYRIENTGCNIIIIILLKNNLVA